MYQTLVSLGRQVGLVLSKQSDCLVAQVST